MSERTPPINDLRPNRFPRKKGFSGNRPNKPSEIDKNEFMKERSGAAISEAEQTRLKDVIPNKNVDELEFENKMNDMQDYLNTAKKIKENSQSYEHGGEVIVGKGKDYIKDLL